MRKLFCDVCAGKMPEYFATYKEKRCCSQECFNKAVAKDKLVNPVMETMYRASLDDYPPNGRDL